MDRPKSGVLPCGKPPQAILRPGPWLVGVLVFVTLAGARAELGVRMLATAEGILDLDALRELDVLSQFLLVLRLEHFLRHERRRVDLPAVRVGAEAEAARPPGPVGAASEVGPVLVAVEVEVAAARGAGGIGGIARVLLLLLLLQQQQLLQQQLLLQQREASSSSGHSTHSQRQAARGHRKERHGRPHRWLVGCVVQRAVLLLCGEWRRSTQLYRIGAPLVQL